LVKAGGETITDTLERTSRGTKSFYRATTFEPQGKGHEGSIEAIEHVDPNVLALDYSGERPRYQLFTNYKTEKWDERFKRFQRHMDCLAGVSSRLDVR